MHEASFSQRRVIGFRQRFEFEKRRLLLPHERGFLILGYEHHTSTTSSY